MFVCLFVCSLVCLGEGIMLHITRTALQQQPSPYLVFVQLRVGACAGENNLFGRTQTHRFHKSINSREGPLSQICGCKFYRQLLADAKITPLRIANTQST